MRDRYFFDKRDWKRRFVKYGIIFLISFLPIVLFNIYCSDLLGQDWLVIFVDCVLLLIFVVIGNLIANKIYEKKDAKLERLRREREEIEERKIQIMEDSYKRKRAEKQKVKSEKHSDIVEVEEDKVIQNNKNKTTKTKSSNTKEQSSAKINSKIKKKQVANDSKGGENK